MWTDFWDTDDKHTKLATVSIDQSEEQLQNIPEDNWRTKGGRVMSQYFRGMVIAEQIQWFSAPGFWQSVLMEVSEQIDRDNHS